MATPSPISAIRNCDDDADVGERRQQQHQHERRQDRHGGDEQGQQGQEGREDEQEDEQGTGGADEYLDQNAGAVLFATCCEQRVRGQPALEPLCGGGCFQRRVELRLDVRAELHRHRRLDQGIRRATVIRHEARIPGAGEVDDPKLQVWNGRRGGREDPADRLAVRRDRLTRGDCDHGDVGVVGADAVGLDQLLLRPIARLTWQGEVKRPTVAQRTGREQAGDEQDHPQSADGSTVMHDEAGEAFHGDSRVSRLAGQTKVLVEGDAYVVLDQIRVQCDRGGRAGTGGRDDLGPRIDDVPSGPDTGNAGASHCVCNDPAVGVDEAAQADEQAAVRDEAWWHEERVPGDHAAVVHLHAAEAIIGNDEPFDRAFDDADSAGDQLGSLRGGEGVGWREVDQVVGPLADDLRIAHVTGFPPITPSRWSRTSWPWQ